MRDDPNSVMIFAAGFGTRMGALTQDRPKPLVEIAGRPLIEHALDQVTDYGAERVVITLASGFIEAGHRASIICFISSSGENHVTGAGTAIGRNGY